MVMLERRADPNDGADVEVHQWSSGRSSGVSNGSGGRGDGGGGGRQWSLPSGGCYGGNGGGDNGGSDGDGGDGGATATRTDGKDKAGTATAAAAAGGREDGGRRRTSRTLFKLRISCGPYEPSVMTLDVRYMQLPIRPSSMPASKVTFSQLRQVSYAGWWKGGQGGATANTQCC